MRTALLDRITGGRKASRRFRPPPVRGLNLRDNPLSLRPDEALYLSNWIAFPDKVETRKGRALHCATPAEAKSLLAYSAAGTVRLFAATDTNLYDVSTPTAAAQFAVTSADFAHFNFQAGSLNYLYAFNGTDEPKLFDGTTWQTVNAASAPIAITGIATTNIIAGTPYNERLFFIKSNSKSLFYLTVGSVGGVMTEYPLGRYLALGGSLLAISTVSVDGGEGFDDYLLVASTEGEILMFRGTDPADVTKWALKGSYRVGRPLNKHAFRPYGTETLYLCELGLLSMPAALQNSSTGRSLPLSDRVAPAITSAIELYGAGNKWRIEYNPSVPCILLNVPEAAGFQFVQHSRSGAWSSFTGWKANDMLYVGGVFYYADSEGVHRAFTGSQDGGVPITARAIGAPDALAGITGQTEVTGVRPTFRYTSPFQYGVRISHNLEDLVPDSIYSVSGTNALVWNVGFWNVNFWAGGQQIEDDWLTPETKPAERVALALQVFIGTGTVDWLGTDWAYKGTSDW